MAKSKPINPNHRLAADWMAQEFNTNGILSQPMAAHSINEKFGKDCVYINKNFHLGINKDVLKEFRNLTPDAIYVNKGKYWTKKTNFNTTTTSRKF